ncbi:MULTISPECIES: hypothetical protein [unclassified Saccharopolyspora]|uniref:hypothetical protein n=1 Tax=Saccharopolyspora TaxID=1835 RepID=UPI00190D451E|nr:hypothetical protein [Saccharopolyspora sp. HNM0986]MBK0868807.1 hypothetical protein [Saccharopolyspora sp. HNM0986]
MLKALARVRVTLVLLALSSFLVCALPPHHSPFQQVSSVGQGIEHSSHPSPDDHMHGSVESTAVELAGSGEHDHESYPVWVCDGESPQVMGMGHGTLTKLHADAASLFAAALVILAGFAGMLPALRFCHRPRSPVHRLSGFPLLLFLGVSRT